MSYFLTKQLPSCFVERKLLFELESYAKRKSAELIMTKHDLSKPKLDFTIQDTAGIEKLKAVEDFQRSYFLDDTEEIKIESVEVGKENNLFIEIQFTPNKRSSKVTVRFDGKSAREVSIGIVAEIISIVESYKTSNYIFHAYGGIPIAVLVALGAGVVAGCFSYIKQSPLSTLAIVVLGSVPVIALFVFTEIYKPYSTFETRRNEKRAKQVSWVLLGFLGFILFTVIGVYFRQKLFGF